METTVWKEKCIGNKLNIYTSIQCVVSRDLTLGKLGILQSKDCTQWGIHSQFLLKWSQNNKQFWVDSFITQIVPIYHPVFTLGFQAGRQAALQSLFLQQQFYFQKATSWFCKTEKGGFEVQHQLNLFLRYNKDWRAWQGCYIPTYCWVGRLWAGLLGARELLPLLVMVRRYWSVRWETGHEWARSQRDLQVDWKPSWWPSPEDQAVKVNAPNATIFFLVSFFAMFFLFTNNALAIN